MKHLVFILFLGLACNQPYQPHDNLISWSSDFVMEDGEEATPYYTNHVNFIKPYLTTNYQKDTLTVTTLKEVNACGEAVADIIISNDTLYLLAIETATSGCASISFNKYTYVIHNPENKQFVVISEK